MSHIHRLGGLQLRPGYCLAAPAENGVFDVEGEVCDSKVVVSGVSVDFIEREFPTDGLTTSVLLLVGLNGMSVGSLAIGV